VKRLLDHYIDGVTALSRGVFLAASALMLAIVPVMLYGVFMRYVMGTPSVWAMELATLMFGPYFLLGGPYLLHTHGHVNLDLLQRAVSPRINRFFELLNYPIIMIFAGVLLVYAWPFAMQSWQYGETSYSSWNPAVWPVKFFIPAALVLMAAQALAEWLRVLIHAEAALPATHDSAEAPIE